MTGAHRIGLGDTGWSVWRDVALRSTGFPARKVLDIADDALADAADRYVRGDGDTASYAAEYEAATARLSAAVRGLASEPRFREAITWQNPRLVENCLDKAAAGERRNVRGRNHELAISSYLQRYTLKNDTVGFFGPVGWARAEETDRAMTVETGPDLLSRRTTYFEVWAIDELARTIAALPGMAVWLVPRPDPATVVTRGVLHGPRRRTACLSPEDDSLFALCDGRRTVRDLAALVGEPESAVLAAVDRLVEAGAVRTDLEGPMQARPEQELRERLRLIDAPEVREPAMRSLDELVAGRDAVAAAAGDADKVATALGALRDAFERVTDADATRRDGLVYAGRTLVYEDTRRDVDVTIGRPVLDALAAPLGLALDSARWLVNDVTRRYRDYFLTLFERHRSRRRTRSAPLHHLILTATPQLLTPSPRQLTDLTAASVQEFQRRWQRVLRVPEGVRRHRLGSEEIAARIAEEFPAGPVAWSAAVQHSPDVMIAADDAAAVERGDFLLVLGELHLTINTLESRLFVEQHDDPGRLLDASRADHGDRRVYAVPDKRSPFVTSRVSPPSALLSPDYTYWTSGVAASHTPGTTLPTGALFVHREGDRLVVRSRTDGREFDLFEMIGEVMSSLVANAFRPFGDAAHRPRVTIDRFVLSRESWSFEAADTAWAFVRDERERFAAARHWRSEHGLPERAFTKVPVEHKPTAVDFRSLPLVNALAKGVRATAEAGGRVTLTELLPDLDQLWLRDGRGERYTSEFRLVTVDGSSPAPTPGGGR